jgi:hypothetical protein
VKAADGSVVSSAPCAEDREGNPKAISVNNTDSSLHKNVVSRRITV